jgi:hypothetical protein
VDTRVWTASACRRSAVCAPLVRHLPQNPRTGKKSAGLLDGFLVAVTDFELDVDAVYTGAPDGQLERF